MEKTTLINGNGQPYEVEVPEVHILGVFNEVALSHLIEDTGIQFEVVGGRYMKGKPETWEQFSSIFLSYNFLTRHINNWEGHFMELRMDTNSDRYATLYYKREGEEFCGVRGI